MSNFEIPTTLNHLLKGNLGSSVVEVLLAGSVLGLLVIALGGTLIYGNQSTALAGQRNRAVFLAEEGLEASRAIRNNSYSSLVNGTYGLASSSGKWVFSGSSDTVDAFFNRQIAISDNGTNRKLITSTVTWQQNMQRSGSVSLVTELTNWAKNIGNWALSSIEAVFDLTLANSGEASADGRAIAFANNKVYLARANGSGREFFIFDMSNPATPTIVGQRELTGNANEVVINGNYAYIATDSDTAELQIVDISDPTTIANAGKLTSVDLTASNSNNANADAIALAVSGNYLIMVRNGGDEFLIFNLSTPASPGNPIGRIATVTGVPTDVAVSGNYAYVSSTDNAGEFQVVDITTKTSPTRVGALDLNSGNAGADALSIEAVGSYALVGRSSTSAPDLYAISVGTPTTPTLASTLDIGGDVKSISYDNNSGYAYLATNDAGGDFKVVNAGNLTVLGPIIGSLDISTTPVKIVYDYDLNRAFIASTDNFQELTIIKPQ